MIINGGQHKKRNQSLKQRNKKDRNNYKIINNIDNSITTVIRMATSITP